MTNIPLLPIELQFTNIMTVLHFSNQACSHLNMWYILIFFNTIAFLCQVLECQWLWCTVNRVFSGTYVWNFYIYEEWTNASAYFIWWIIASDLEISPKTSLIFLIENGWIIMIVMFKPMCSICTNNLTIQKNSKSLISL